MTQDLTVYLLRYLTYRNEVITLGIIMKSFEDIEKMYSEDIRCEMLQIWHELDFNQLSEEEKELAIKTLKMYNEILRERHYER